jgi:hypothetical protein
LPQGQSVCRPINNFAAGLSCGTRLPRAEKLSVAVVELVRLDERLKDFARRIDNLERR